MSAPLPHARGCTCSTGCKALAKLEALGLTAAEVTGPPCHCVYEDQRRVAVGVECGHMLGVSLLAEEDRSEGWFRHEVAGPAERPHPPAEVAALRRPETRAEYYARRARGER